MISLRQEVVRLSEATKNVEDKTSSPTADFAPRLQAFTELHNVVESIRQEQAGQKFLTWKRSENFGQLLEWISSLPGAEISRVTVKEALGRGYGVYATAQVTPDDSRPVIRIPHTACIFPSFVSTFPIGRCISILPLPDNLKLVGILMSEAANLSESTWKRYISCLPTEFCTTMHLDPNSVALLQGSLYLDDALQRYCNICKHYVNSVIAVDLKAQSKTDKKKFGAQFTFDLFRWALDVVMTRSNAVPVPGCKEPILALVPLLEMVNHGKDEEKFVCVSDEGSTFFAELRISHTVEEGEEVLMAYQPLSVKNRFINHAFVTLDEGILQFFMGSSADLGRCLITYHNIAVQDLPLDSEKEVSELLDGYDVVIQRRSDGKLDFLAEFFPFGQATESTIAVLRASITRISGVNEIANAADPAVEKLVYTMIVRAASELLKRITKSAFTLDAATHLASTSVEQLCWTQIQAEKTRLEAIRRYNSEKLKSILMILVSQAKNTVSEK